MAEPLDQAALDSLLAMVGDDPEFVDELVDAYLDDAPVQIAAMRAAVASGSVDALVRPAHTLKGSSANLGAKVVETLCRGIEERARAGAVDNVPQLLAELDSAYGELGTALSAARDRRWAAS